MAGSKLSWPQIEGAPLSGGVTSIQQESAYNFALYSRHAGSRSSLPAARATAGPSGGNPDVSLPAAVPTRIIVSPVPVTLAVGLVMLREIRPIKSPASPASPFDKPTRVSSRNLPLH